MAAREWPPEWDELADDEADDSWHAIAIELHDENETLRAVLADQAVAIEQLRARARGNKPCAMWQWPSGRCGKPSVGIVAGLLGIVRSPMCEHHITEAERQLAENPNLHWTIERGATA
jgi:hypothetical protein